MITVDISRSPQDRGMNYHPTERSAATPARLIPLGRRNEVAVPSPKQARPPLLLPPVPELVGRDAELRALVKHLDQGLLIVSGNRGAGVGATALARCIVAAAVSDYPDGCVEVNLHGGAPGYVPPLEPSEVQRRVLLSLDPQTPPPEERRSLLKAYRSALAEHKAVIILDNVASPIQLRYLLPREGSTVIVTSESDISSSFSKLFSCKLDGLEVNEARSLMMKTSPHAGRLSRRAMERLTQRLNGVPLALRIIAPLVGESTELSYRQIMRHLDEAHRRIVALRGPQVLSTPVDVALEAAYELLAPELKPRFEALAFFSAPFTVEAAAAVWATSVDKAKTWLERFVERSLVNHQPGHPLYEVHLLVRLYAQELLLGQTDRTRHLISRYASHILDEALQVSARLGVENEANSGTTASSHLRLRLQLLWQHLPQAWDRVNGKDPGWPQPKDADRWASGFPLRAMPLLKPMLPQRELRTWLLDALGASERTGDQHMRGLLLGALGNVSHDLDDGEAALDYFEQQLDVARRQEDRRIEAEALMHIAQTQVTQGDTRGAGASWRKALVLLDLLGDERAAFVRNKLVELQHPARV